MKVHEIIEEGLRKLGGKGSGNFGHAGRPGKRGGSVSRGKGGGLSALNSAADAVVKAKGDFTSAGWDLGKHSDKASEADDGGWMVESKATPAGMGRYADAVMIYNKNGSIREVEYSLYQGVYENGTGQGYMGGFDAKVLLTPKEADIRIMEKESIF